MSCCEWPGNPVIVVTVNTLSEVNTHLLPWLRYRKIFTILVIMTSVKWSASKRNTKTKHSLLFTMYFRTHWTPHLMVIAFANLLFLTIILIKINPLTFHQQGAYERFVSDWKLLATEGKAKDHHELLGWYNVDALLKNLEVLITNEGV